MAPASSSAPAAVTKGGDIGNGPADDGRYHALSLTLGKLLLPMAVRAVLELSIPDILAKAKGRKSLTAEEILVQLPTKCTPGPNSITNLNRLLRPLVREGLFSESLNDERKPVYGLTATSEWFVGDREDTLQPFSALNYSKTLFGMWSRFHDLILDEDVTPFEAEMGVSCYKYTQENPEFGALFNNAMVSLASGQVKDVVDALQGSGILEGVKTIVDVGGGRFAMVVGGIIARNPHIKGINFDLPRVIETAIEVPGVQHVAGSFKDSVPAGDVLLLKHIIHNYGDEEATKILETCFQALPEKGKVIIAEGVLKESPDTSQKDFFLESMDLTMLGALKGGQERTAAEYEKLLSGVGFSRMSVIEGRKEVDLIQAFKE